MSGTSARTVFPWGFGVSPMTVLVKIRQHAGRGFSLTAEFDRSVELRHTDSHFAALILCDRRASRQGVSLGLSGRIDRLSEALASQTVASIDTFIIALLPQTGQRHLSANGPADEGQSQWVSGCFIGGTLLEGQLLASLLRPRPWPTSGPRDRPSAVRTIGRAWHEDG